MSRRPALDRDTARAALIQKIEAEAKRYFSDAQQVFWLAALEADAQGAEPLASGHEAVRKHLSDCVADKFLIRDDDIDFVTGSEAVRRHLTSSSEDHEPALDEPDSTEQQAKLYDVLSLLLDEDQTIIQDQLDGIPQAQTATRLGIAQQSVSERRASITARVKAVIEMRAHPFVENDLARCRTDKQREEIRKVMSDQQYSVRTVLRGLAYLTGTSTDRHVRLMMRWRGVTRWARKR